MFPSSAPVDAAFLREDYEYYDDDEYEETGKTESCVARCTHVVRGGSGGKVLIVRAHVRRASKTV